MRKTINAEVKKELVKLVDVVAVRYALDLDAPSIATNFSEYILNDMQPQEQWAIDIETLVAFESCAGCTIKDALIATCASAVLDDFTEYLDAFYPELSLKTRL